MTNRIPIPHRTQSLTRPLIFAKGRGRIQNIIKFPFPQLVLTRFRTTNRLTTMPKAGRPAQWCSRTPLIIVQRFNLFPVLQATTAIGMDKKSSERHQLEPRVVFVPELFVSLAFSFVLEWIFESRKEDTFLLQFYANLAAHPQALLLYCLLDQQIHR